ncbi:S8 family serine peptidase [Massilia atriviolacea]|nr:S8 family serine peptidase [Massilia atriviolacea]
MGKRVHALAVSGLFGAAALGAMAGAQAQAGTAGASLAQPAANVLAASVPARITNEAGSVHYIVTFADAAAQRYSAKAVSDPRFGADHDGRVMRLLHEVEAAHRIAATHAYSHTLQGFAAYLTVQQVEALRRDPRIKAVAANVPIESSASAVWSDVAVGASTLPWGVQAVGGSSTSNGGATVYVVDSGIGNHPDVAVSARWNAPGACAIGTYPHSTFVAGIIAARNDTVGVTGVNAGVKLVSLAYGDNQCAAQSKTLANAIAALDEAKRRIRIGGRVAVVNLSSNFEMPTATTPGTPLAPAFMQSVRSLIKPDPATGYPGAFFVQSAGNKYKDACQWSFNDRLPSDGAMVVGAIDNNGQPVQPLNGEGGFNAGDPRFGPEPGSNFGPCVDAWAPGKRIVSTWMNGTAPTYISSSGTSWAAPHVAALAARLIETTPTLRTPAEVENAVRARLVSGGALTQGQPLRSASLTGAAYSARPTVEFKIGSLPSGPTPPVFGDAPTPALVGSGKFFLRYDAIGAQSCDVRSYVDGNLVEQKLGQAPVFTWGELTRGVGLHRWDVDCRAANGATNSASASARVVKAAPAPVVVFSIDGVPTVKGVRRFIPTTQAFTLSYAAAGASSCNVLAYRTAPDGWLGPWFESPNQPAAYSWTGLRLTVATHRWRVECKTSNPSYPIISAEQEIDGY